MPTVSIITPAYNRARLLTRVWHGISDQETELEWIVVDDGSTDDTGNVMAGIDDQRVIYLKHDENRGVNAARNTGSAAARGRYVIFLDSDDELVCGDQVLRYSYIDLLGDIYVLRRIERQFKKILASLAEISLLLNLTGYYIFRANHECL
ncbi:MAG: glycosyltransferase family 2 protein [Thermoleophilia bacterium]|nr:glycosyltransferase family 2 protein [Thermoleophilia bacterium]